jgi:predicted secreted Zn-dependent protease
VVTEDTESYAISGTTTDEIFEALNGSKLVDESGVPAIGLTDARWSYEYTARETSERCAMESLTLRLDIVVTLPSLTNEASLDPQLRARWKAFEDAVREHEMTHVELERAGVEELRNLLDGLAPEPAGCSALEATIEAMITQHREVVTQRHQQFHLDEEARLEEARAPLQARIDAALASIQSRNAEADALKPRISAVAAQVDAKRAELSALVAPYPHGVPEPQYSEALELQREVQGLVSTYNALIAEYNSIVAEVDGLILQRNALLEEYVWIQ